MPPLCEVGVEALLETEQPPLLEPCRLGLGEVVEGELGQRRSAPDRECFVRPTLVPQPLELRQVELVGTDVQLIAGKAKECSLARLSISA